MVRLFERRCGRRIEGDESVGLVDEQPMRQTCCPSFPVDGRSDTCDVVVLLLLCEQRHVEDDAAEAVADQTVDLTWLWERLDASDREDPSNAVESEVVAFDVDHYGRVAEVGHRLCQQPSEVGLSHPGAAGDEHVDLRRWDGDGLSVVRSADADPPACGKDSLLSGEERAPQQLRDAAPVGFVENEVGVGFEGFDGVRDCDAVLARFEEATVVLGVADRDGAVAGHADVAERLEEPRGLGDPSGQHHERGSVPQDLAVEAEAADLFENDEVMGCIAEAVAPNSLRAGQG